jgi:hypothetical protein
MTQDPHAIGDCRGVAARSHAFGESRGGTLRSSPVLWVPVCHLARLVTTAIHGDLIEDSPMARKGRKSNDINPATGLPWRLHAPRETRVVAAGPKIRLSGAWLERIGFSEGRSFLVLPDTTGVIVLALLDR